jgi:hypothetical protein
MRWLSSHRAARTKMLIRNSAAPKFALVGRRCSITFRSANVRFWRRKARHSHPHFWAGFISLGDWRPMTLPVMTALAINRITSSLQPKSVDFRTQDRYTKRNRADDKHLILLSFWSLSGNPSLSASCPTETKNPANKANPEIGLCSTLVEHLLRPSPRRKYDRKRIDWSDFQTLLRGMGI